MPTQKWVCDTCEEPYETEEEAEDCETLHATPEEREAGREWTPETVAARLGLTVEEWHTGGGTDPARADAAKATRKDQERRGGGQE